MFSFPLAIKNPLKCGTRYNIIDICDHNQNEFSEM